MVLGQQRPVCACMLNTLKCCLSVLVTVPSSFFHSGLDVGTKETKRQTEIFHCIHFL